MPRWRPSERDKEDLARALHGLVKAAYPDEANAILDTLGERRLPRRYGIDALVDTLATYLEDPTEAGGSCVDDILDRRGGRRTTAQGCILLLAGLGVLRPVFASKRHQKGQYFQLATPGPFEDGQREALLRALAELLTTRIAQRDGRLGQLIRSAHDVLAGNLGPDEFTDDATQLGSAYLRWLERESRKYIARSRVWEPRDWESTCGYAMSTGHCVLPRAHHCGHHDNLARVHHVRHDNGSVSPLAEVLPRIHIQTLADAEAFLGAHMAGRHLAFARRAGVDPVEVVRVRELVELAIRQDLLSPGPTSPLMIRNMRRLGLEA